MGTPPQLSHKASQETMISLLQLDPQPIESPLQEKPLPPLPEENVHDSTGSLKSQSTYSTSGSLGLSGGGHGSLYYCSLHTLLCQLGAETD